MRNLHYHGSDQIYRPSNEQVIEQMYQITGGNSEGNNRPSQNAQLTVVDGDGTITATRAPNIPPCTVNLDSQKYRQLRVLEKPNVRLELRRFQN